MLIPSELAIEVLPTGYMDRRNAAAALGRRPKTLANWKSQGVGPTSFRVLGRAYYKWDDVQRFAGGECVSHDLTALADPDLEFAVRRRKSAVVAERQHEADSALGPMTIW
jgi:hypothetical protein